MSIPLAFQLPRRPTHRRRSRPAVPSNRTVLAAAAGKVPPSAQMVSPSTWRATMAVWASSGIAPDLDAGRGGKAIAGPPGFCSAPGDKVNSGSGVVALGAVLTEGSALVVDR